MQPRAPADVLRPWLDPTSRADSLREGVLLVDPRATDGEVVTDDPDEDIFVSEAVSSGALLRGIGAPPEHPCYRVGALRLTFVPW